MSRKTSDVWAYIAWYANVITIAFIIGFLIFVAAINQVQLESLAPFSRDSWELVAEKIIKLLFVMFTITLVILWAFGWMYLVDQWESRTSKINKRLIILMIFIPIIGVHILYFEHRKLIKDF